MRIATAFAVLLSACSTVASAGSVSTNTPARCVPTTTRDASGVVTADGVTGIVGEASTAGSTAMNDHLVLVRRGAHEGQQITLRFDDVGRTSPATWVSYGVIASARPNPWGELVFDAGWKPIGFAGSCWRVLIDGVDSGLVLEVRS